MRRTFVVVLIGFFIAAAGYGSFVLYQHHLSTDVKALLVAACADSVSVNEVRSYLHDARPLLRTSKDRQTFEKLEKAVTELSDYQQYENGALGRLKTEMEEATENGECSGRWWRLIRSGALKNDRAEENQAYQEMKACEQRRQDSQEAEERITKAEFEDGKRLYNEVRSTLGLPPLKEQ